MSTTAYRLPTPHRRNTRSDHRRQHRAIGSAHDQGHAVSRHDDLVSAYEYSMVP